MKGIIYYTNNRCEERIALAVRRLLESYGYPIISVSQHPIDFGENIVVPFKSGKLSMFKQMLIALEHSGSSIVFCCEHDVVYHRSHFDFMPRDRHTYYFNTNVWTLDAKSGRALWFDEPAHIGRRMTSGLVADKELLINHYKKKIELIEDSGFSKKEHGFAPGKPGVDDHPWDIYQPECPNIDIKHDKNITKGRFKLTDYKYRDKIKDSWRLSDGVPCWGKTEGRFDDFLRSVAI